MAIAVDKIDVRRGVDTTLTAVDYQGRITSLVNSIVRDLIKEPAEGALRELGPADPSTIGELPRLAISHDDATQVAARWLLAGIELTA